MLYETARDEMNEIRVLFLQARSAFPLVADLTLALRRARERHVLNTIRAEVLR